jgi:transcriptional regulator with XRE-family HTH domain
MDIYERLDYLMKAKNLTAYRLSKELGYNKPGTFYAILSRKVKPSYDTLTAILTKYDDLNGDWLLRGTGEAFKNSASTALLQTIAGQQEIVLTESQPNSSLLQERIASLEQQLRDREEIIVLLKQQILLLKELAQRHAPTPAS